MDFTSLFSIQPVNEHDLCIIKQSNFFEFLKFLPEGKILEFKEYQKLICPLSTDSAAFPIWITNVLAATKLKQSDLCDRIKMNESKLSKFLKGDVQLTTDETIALKNSLKRELILKELVKP